MDISFWFFLVFAGASVLATLALSSHQPLLVAYLALGALIGPYGLGYVQDVGLLSSMSEAGIMLLLFLIGLDMQPSAVLSALRQVVVTALLSSLLFGAVGFGLALAFGLSSTEAALVGTSMMFSSTIIAIKLLPTTVLHHRHMGELMVGLLLVQDLMAIVVLVVILAGGSGNVARAGLSVGLGLPLVIAVAVVGVRFVLLPLLTRFDRFQEYIFLLAMGWCLGLAQLAHSVGLSAEIGAFVAGVALASHPISQFIALALKPLRDFFLVLFFCSLGAGFDLSLIPQVGWTALVLALTMLALKPVVFRFLLGRFSERSDLAWDVGFRLGQNSEFSLLVAYAAVSAGLLGREASHVIQATAILTFVLSSYLVVFNFPTPIATTEKLRRD